METKKGKKRDLEGKREGGGWIREVHLTTLEMNQFSPSDVIRSRELWTNETLWANESANVYRNHKYIYISKIEYLFIVHVKRVLLAFFSAKEKLYFILIDDSVGWKSQGRTRFRGEISRKGERIFVEKVELRFVLVARFMDHVASNITRLYGILKVSPWIIIVLIRANNACNARVAGFARLILIVIR